MNPPAATCQCLGASRAGETGADHHSLPRSVVGRGRLMSPHEVARRKASNEQMPLAAVAAAQLDVEARRFQRLSDRAGARVGREHCIRARAARDAFEQHRLPHLGVAVGCEAVKKDCIGADDQAGHQFTSVAERQCQRDPTRLEFATMQPAQRQRPTRRKRTRQFAQLGRCRIDEIDAATDAARSRQSADGGNARRRRATAPRSRGSSCRGQTRSRARQTARGRASAPATRCRSMKTCRAWPRAPARLA